MCSVRKLLGLVRSGDSDAFSELYGSSKDKLLAVARKKLSDPEEAEDIVQDVFSNLWLNRTKIPIVATMGYLVIIVNRRCVDFLRAKYTRQEYKEKIAETKQPYIFHDLYENKELGIIMAAAFNSLPIRIRQVCELFLIHQFSTIQISLELGIAVQTVKNHILSGRRLLKSYIVGIQKYGEGSATELLPTKRRGIHLEMEPDPNFLKEVEKLPIQMRDILVMQVVFKMEIGEIADSLQLSFESVRQHITAAHRKLRSPFGEVKGRRLR